MPEYSAGTASIRIRPNADDFVRDLKAKLSGMRDPGFEVGVEANIDGSKLDRWRREEESNGVDVDVDADTAGASGKMDVWRAKEEANPVEVRVVIDHQAADRQLSDMQRKLEGFARSDFTRVNIAAGILEGVGPAVTGLANLAGALQQVSQAGLAVPGGIAAAAASIGTLVFGLGGVSDAYKAVTKEAEQSGKTSASEARQAESASNSLRNAIVDEARARDDVNRATREAAQNLRDLRIEQRGGLLDESRAILDAQQARERLASGKFSDVRDALLDVAEADQRITEVRARNIDTTEKLVDANTKGIANSDRVVNANEQLTRSHQQVAQAQAQAQDATTKTTSVQDKATLAMGKLGPNAQAFVKQLVDMKPAVQDLRTSISQPLFEGKAEELDKTFNRMLPTVQKGAVGIAAAWNQNISALAGSVSDEKGLGLIDRVLGNTGDAQSRLTNAIDPLVKGIGTLTAAGSDSLPRVADGVTKVSERFKGFITAADERGDLDKWINKGIDGLTSLGNTAINFGKIFTGITKASDGEGFLQWLRTASEKWQQWVNSDVGQNKIKQFFDEGKQTAAEWKPILAELPSIFKGAMDGASTYVGGFMPLLRELSQLMGDHPGLVQAAIAAYATWKTIDPIVNTTMGLMGRFNDGVIGVGTSFYRTRDDAKRAMKDVDDTFEKSGNAGSKMNKFASKIGALGALGGPFAALATVAIPGLIAAMDSLDRKNQESAEATKQLEDAQLSLETTLDRVTGKITAQTRDQLISGAQQYDASGRPGGGIPGISKGDALGAATKLGIPPDLYADALEGKPDAIKKVRDVLVNNNVAPEFDVNKDLGKRAATITAQTGGQIDQNLLLAALTGDPAAVDKYQAIITEKSKGNPSLSNTGDLAEIAKSLSATGQASVLSGGALGFQQRATAGLGGPTQQANQAQYGRFRIKAGAGGPFPDGAQVGSSGGDYRVVVSADMAGALDAQKIPYDKNPDGTLTAKVPLDSPYIEKYAKGGPTPGGKSQGFMAMLHGQEWVHDAATVDMYGEDFMNALWRKKIDPRVARSMIPHLDKGGSATDDSRFDPNTYSKTRWNHNSMHRIAPDTGRFNPAITIDTSRAGIAPPIREKFDWETYEKAILPPGQSGYEAFAPGFEGGGPTDPKDPNYVAIATGQGPGGVAPGPVAPNPTAGGSLNSIVGSTVSGLGNVFNNLQSLQSLIPQAQPGGVVDPNTTVHGTAAGALPGPADGGVSAASAVNQPNSFVNSFLSGLGIPGLGGNQNQQQNDHGWGPGGPPVGLGGGAWTADDKGQLVPPFDIRNFGIGPGPAGSGPGDWMAFTGKTLGTLGAGLVSTFASGVLGMVGMEGALNSPYLQSAGKAAAHFLGADQQQLMTATGTTILPGSTGTLGPTSTPTAADLQALSSAGIALTPENLDAIFGGGAGGGGPALPADLSSISTAGTGGGLQVNTARGEAIIKKFFPWATNIGGVRADALKWHPSGLALDVMIPGAGGNNDPTPAAGKAQGDQLYAWLKQHQSELGIDYILWQEKDHFNHLHVNFAASGYPNGAAAPNASVAGPTSSPPTSPKGGPGTTWFPPTSPKGGPGLGTALTRRRGGPTPGSRDTEVPAILHGKEFVHQASAVDKYGVDFMRALNDGQIDPDSLPHFALGGSVQDLFKAAAVRPSPLPRPPDVIQKAPPARPVRPAPARPAPMPAPQPPAPLPTPTGPPAGPPQPPAPPGQAPMPGMAPTTNAAQSNAPGGRVDYTLPWVNTAIESGASTIGNIAATAISMATAAAGGAGAGGSFGGSMGISAAGALGAQIAQGLAQQGGKIVQGIANVVSAGMVGSVPGSFTTTPEAYGRTMRPEQRELATAATRNGGTVQYGPFFGHSSEDVMQQINVHESINQQVAFANHPGRI